MPFILNCLLSLMFLYFPFCVLSVCLRFAQALKDQIQSIVGPGTRIDMRAGSLSIAGNHTAQLRNWLSHLGF